MARKKGLKKSQKIKSFQVVNILKDFDKLRFVELNVKCKTQSAECRNCVANYRYNSFGVLQGTTTRRPADFDVNCFGLPCRQPLHSFMVDFNEIQIKQPDNFKFVGIKEKGRFVNRPYILHFAFCILHLFFIILVSFADYESCWCAFETENFTNLVIDIALITVMEQVLVVYKANECWWSC